MRYPDEPLQSQQISLDDYVRLVKRLYDEQAESRDSSDEMRFARVVLAGRDDNNRLFVNAAQGLGELSAFHYRTYRDIDSAHGITKTLPFTEALSVFPIAPFTETLKKDIHIKGLAYGSTGDSLSVSLHKIPNIALGKVKQRHVTRLFFPRMYTGTGDSRISSETLAYFYNRILRKAVIDVVPECQSYWPIDYASAMTQSKDKRGQLHFSSMDISAPLLPDFEESLMHRLNQSSYFKDAYFLHELRGVKGQTHHDTFDPAQREAALDHALEFLDQDRIEVNDWKVDVAIGIWSPDSILQWRTSGHHAVLKHVLPSLSDEKLSALLKSSSRTKIDASCQLTDFSGCRVIPGSDGKTDHILYVQKYTSDKNLTYQLHEGIYRRRGASELLPASIDRLMGDLHRIGETFIKACGGEVDENELGDGVESVCRLEVRIPLRYALSKLLYVPQNIITRVICKLPIVTWWSFKFYRLAAIQIVVERLSRAPPEARIWKESLILGAVTVYMHNALIYRPAEGARETELVETACQHELPTGEFTAESDTDDAETVPVISARGLYFLSDLVDDKSPRLPRVRTMDEHSLAGLYGASCLADIFSIFKQSGPRGQTGESHPGRVPNRCRKTMDIRYTHEDPMVVETNELRVDGVRVRDRMRMQGRDADMVIDDYIDQHFTSTDPDELIATVMAQFPVDVFELSPNHMAHSEGAHTLMSARRRDKVSMDIFHSYDLRGIFDKIQYSVINEERLKRFIFPRFFPPKGKILPKSLQNFRKSTYFGTWRDLMDRVSNHDAERIRDYVFSKFRLFRWLPYAQSDRMWATSVMKTKSWKMVPSTPKSACPQLAFIDRYWLKESRTLQVGPDPAIIDLREEEEESSEESEDNMD